MRIGNLNLENGLLFAPIAGYSDIAFRQMCYDYGADMCYTEMVSAKGLCYKNEKTKDLLVTADGEKNTAVQLFGGEPEYIAKAIASEPIAKFPVIDLNMGCPVPKIVKNGEGSFLMTRPDLVYDIVKAAVDAAGGRPVTVKIRAGFTEKNAPLVAEQIEKAGGSAVTVHGRTRDMFYSGTADYDIIATVKKAVSIPVIGNGDVVDRSSYQRMLDTGVDGVMIARGALGRPYLYSELLGRSYEYDLISAVTRHIDLLRPYLREDIITKDMKKHVVCYVKGYRNQRQAKDAAFKAETIDELLDAVRLVTDYQK